MKVFVFAALLAVAAARPQAPMMHHDHHHGHEASAGILEHDFQMMEPGQYMYKFKTENGIEMMEQAALAREAGQAVQGVFSYVAPNGEKVAVRYVADESGFHPEGDHIPKMPAAIARALEWIAAHPDPEARKWDMN